METEGESSRRLKELQHQLRRRNSAVEDMVPLLNQFASHLLRRDQAASLDNLSARIIKEVEEALMAENMARSNFNKQKLIAGGIGFAATTLIAASLGKEDALSRGGKSFISAINRAASFGTVLVSIGKGGLPEDVRVLPVSNLARQFNKTELEINKAIREHGHLLMTVDTFSSLTQVAKKGILNGSISLPLTSEKICGALPGIIYNPGSLISITMVATFSNPK